MLRLMASTCMESVGLWTTINNGPRGSDYHDQCLFGWCQNCQFPSSPAENEIFSCLVALKQSLKIQRFEEDCIQFFKDLAWFLPNLALGKLVRPNRDERFKIIIKIFHRHNFQNEEAKNERSQKVCLVNLRMHWFVMDSCYRLLIPRLLLHLCK